MGSKYENLLVDGSGNVVQSFYDNFLKSNGDFRSKAGFRMTVIRESLGVCCAWCQNLVGTYDYDNRPADVYARHKNCTCVVMTKTERGTYQDAWSRKEYDSYRDARIVRANEILSELEESNKRRKALNQNTLVDLNKIKSSDYAKKISKIDADKKINREIYNNIKDMLKHRSGTEFEDLAFIDSNSTKSIINKAFDKKMACEPSKKMEILLGETDTFTIIGTHNHPYSSPPSFSDIMVAHERKYKYGVVAGNDGTIYKYTVNQGFNELNGQIYIDKLNKVFYNNGVKSNEFKSVLKDLLDNGIEIEVF